MSKNTPDTNIKFLLFNIFYLKGIKANLKKKLNQYIIPLKIYLADEDELIRIPDQMSKKKGQTKKRKLSPETELFQDSEVFYYNE